METYEFFSNVHIFLDKFLGTISLLNHHSNDHLTSPLECHHIKI